MDTEFNRQGVALPRRTAHDQSMSDAIRQAAAAEIGKHRQLLRTGRDGRILSALMLPLLRWAPPAGYGVLTTTGRKTGRPRHKCVRVIRRGDRAHRGGTFDGIAWEITEGAELEQARSAICDPVFPSDYGECALHLRGLPTRTKVQELHRYWFETGIPVVIDLKETTP